MGAPVYNTGFVGQGTRRPKPVMGPQPSAIEGVYQKYKRVEADAKMLAEIGSGAYTAYQAARQADPVVRAGMVAAGLL